MKMASIFMIVFFNSLTLILANRGDIQPRSLNNSCITYVTCSTCIQQNQCVWCSEPEYASPDGSALPRCNPRQSYKNFDMMGEIRNCQKDYIVDFPVQINIPNERIMTKNAKQSKLGIQPKKISIRSKPKEKISFEIQFHHVKNYALDLYYLMDLSKTMDDDKINLEKLGSQLSNTLHNLTSDFQIGFGSFIDKKLLPYTNTAPRKGDATLPKDEPYLFQNHMKLSSNVNLFTAKVRNAQTYGNMDNPEGGFEALMQAVVCNDQIGWRNESRQLIVYSTDAPFHIAGDGKLGGLAEPNDGKCHLTKDGQYPYDKLQDYPSISQISNKVASNGVHVIFAVTRPVQSTYSGLKERLQGSSLALLSNDSSNVVQLIKEEYNKISSSIEIRHKGSNLIRAKFFSSCLTSGKVTETNRCEGLVSGSVVNFTVELEVTQCKDGKDFQELFEIYPVGIRDSILVDLDIKCECPCEKPQNSNSNDDKKHCSGTGKYKCGICNCFDEYFGQKCECSINSTTTSTTECRKSDSDEECSGRGYCQCNVCNCYPRSNEDEHVWGSYCECNDFSCPRFNDLLCSGQSHGICECGGHCKCYPEWQGDSCQYPADDIGCKPPGTDEPLCSNNGQCVLGKCVCQETQNEVYMGKYCEDCPKCSTKCEEYKDWVRCRAFHTGPLSVEECNRSNYTIIVAENVEEESPTERSCSFLDEDDCYFYFVYSYTDPLVVRVRSEKYCHNPPNVQAIVSSVIGFILGAGIFLLMLWKVSTTVHDRLEYAKFERERALARWNRDENPIYKRPNTLYMNPAYNQE